MKIITIALTNTTLQRAAQPKPWVSYVETDREPLWQYHDGEESDIQDSSHPWFLPLSLFLYTLSKSASILTVIMQIPKIQSRTLLCFLVTSLAASQKIVLPAPNGTYTVGRVTLQLTNTNSLQPFAPNNQSEAPALELSVFYPTNTNSTVNVAYMPPEVARYIDQELSQDYKIDSPNGTFERVEFPLTPEGTKIAERANSGAWNLLLFGSAQGTNRNFYNAIVSQVSSMGYVVITYDTPYDTDIVQYSNESTALINSDVWSTSDLDTLFTYITMDDDVRAQDASFIIDQFSNNNFVASLIPGCKACLNTTHVGVFGHSLGGASTATTMLNDTRVAGALDFDGTLWGSVVDQGLDRPFMLVVEEGNERDAFDAYPGNSWSVIWPKLTSHRFNLIVNNSRHYTFSDYPIVFEILGILPTNETIREKVLLSDMPGQRALHITTSYAVAFFDWLFKGGSAELIAEASPLFPEVSLDTNTTSLEVASQGPNSAGNGARTGSRT